ncbi:hypothetical protein ACHAWF_014197 [Thalassiosira exigua]
MPLPLTPPPHLRRRRRRARPSLLARTADAVGAGPSRLPRALAVAKWAIQILGGAGIAASAVLALQLAWVVWRTPRLPPPPRSGRTFPRKGLVVQARRSGDGEDDDDDKEEEEEDDEDPRREGKEFRIVLVGDSPVEGIGNTIHARALGGQTARAFARGAALLRGCRRVRYWSYGRSGLTARGIETEMVPLLRRVADDRRRDDSGEPAVHAVVLLCGVNNVLDRASTPASFRSEVRSLLTSIRARADLEPVPLIVLGLPDFARLSFLPWPLGFALGMRGRAMQRQLEAAVEEARREEKRRYGTWRTAAVDIPEVQEVLGTVGYLRHDSSESYDCCQKAGLLRLRLCHPLLDHLEGNIDRASLASLQMEDFLCDDGFHPGRHGTTYVGSLIADGYDRLTKRIPWQRPISGRT